MERCTLTRHTNSERIEDSLANDVNVSEFQNNKDEAEMSQGMCAMNLGDPSQVTAQALHISSQQSQPPPIIHSSFPPPPYISMEQNHKAPAQENLQGWMHPYIHSDYYQQQVNGNLMPCGIIPPQSVQLNTSLGTPLYVNYPYNGAEASSTLPYQPPPFIPSVTSTYPTIPPSAASPFPRSPSTMSAFSCGDSGSLGDTGTKDAILPPDDNPGLPIQDEVCPFHQHMSFWAEQLRKNRKTEMAKNEERFCFLKWVDGAFSNITVIPPGTGMWHQLNLEYLARVVTSQDGLLFPDSLVGTDNHTTMVNGLGVLGWSVGTLDAEAVMFGHPLSMPEIPKVVGVRLHGKLKQYATSTGKNNTPH